MKIYKKTLFFIGKDDIECHENWHSDKYVVLNKRELKEEKKFENPTKICNAKQLKKYAKKNPINYKIKRNIFTKKEAAYILNAETFSTDYVKINRKHPVYVHIIFLKMNMTPSEAKKVLSNQDYIKLKKGIDN